MRMQRLLLGTSLLNLVGFVLFAAGGTRTEASPGIIKARAWELVDDEGRTRASLTLADNGEAVLRLRDTTGTIRVKLGASDQGSGLVLLNGNTEVGLQLQADERGATIKLADQNGRERLLRP